MLACEMATDWGIPPWQVTRECSQEWFDWWLSIRVEKAALQEAEANKVKRRGR